MKILVTGNMGYVGSVLVPHLRASFRGAMIIGYDLGYFGHCLTGVSLLPECHVDQQVIGDVRRMPAHFLEGLDAVVHLAAVSNDPMGHRFESVTEEVNHQASIEIAHKAIKAGVGRFVFASSCSVYGSGGDGAKKESDPLNPLTAYAKSKIATEEDLSRLDPEKSIITSLRFSTACGMSDRLRLDLVLNDFVACALSSRKISVLSDGTPWRPLIDVKDMARAIEWALVRDSNVGGQCLSVNVGSASWNYQIKDLAKTVSDQIAGTDVEINTNAAPDKRSYQVDFSLFQKLASDFQPLVTLEQAVSELKSGMERMGFHDTQFRNSQLIRMKVLEKHIAEKRLTENLVWIHHS